MSNAVNGEMPSAESLPGAPSTGDRLSTGRPTLPAAWTLAHLYRSASPEELWARQMMWGTPLPVDVSGDGECVDVWGVLVRFLRLLWWWLVWRECPDCEGTGVCQRPGAVRPHTCCGECDMLMFKGETVRTGVIRRWWRR